MARRDPSCTWHGWNKIIFLTCFAATNIRCWGLSTAVFPTEKVHVHNGIYTGNGVVSLAWDTAADPTCLPVLFAGTKRGTIECFELLQSTSAAENGASKGNFSNEQQMLKPIDSKFEVHNYYADSSSNDNARATSSIPYPIYSMIFHRRDPNTHGSRDQLLCGGGDRYILVWERQPQRSVGNKQQQWTLRQRLGPHTGWVKALSLHPATTSNNNMPHVLYSIGCNCIEGWTMEPSNSLTADFSTACCNWEHNGKRSIESSPQDGATLSSDLLCLAFNPNNNLLLYSGGVDGRIHVWTSSQQQQPLQSIAAHTGRVNVLQVVEIDDDDDHHRLLFSTGHDGALQCYQCGHDNSGDMHNNGWLQNTPLASLQIKNDRTGDVERVTAMSCRRIRKSGGNDDDNQKAILHILLGTANGWVVLVTGTTTTTTNDDCGTVCLQEETRVHLLQEEQPATIHAVSWVPSAETTEEWNSNNPSLGKQEWAVVGHSLGLSTVSFDY